MNTDTTAQAAETTLTAGPTADENATPAPRPTPAGVAPSKAGTENTDSSGSGNSEAARRRVQLREVEAERNALRTRIESLQSAEIARLAAPGLAQPLDLFDIGGMTVADLLTDEGDVDPDKVSDAVADLVTARPGLSNPARVQAQQQRYMDFGQGAGNPGSGPRAASWGKFLRGS
ncbi:hypothetical protein [Rhodococcus sp. 008]|uniref:hypothetical protein n=1 Tax=Rhodococcus sp. 008 TaxID=1723645 RepID=UPI0008063130|nr:hypothetical protein [Rhodococcus sp. 008]ANQ71719.1 hypothetical protein AOT96_13215 [Rhodococcus sp. 008]